MTAYRILHIGDEHHTPSKLSECITADRQIEELAYKHQPKLIILSGDIQDRLLTVEDGSAYEEMIRHVQALAHIAPVVIIYGNESHDPKGSLAPLKYLATVNPVYVSEYPESIGLAQGLGEKFFTYPNSEIAECIIHTLPYPTKQYLAKDAPAGASIDTMNEIANMCLGQIMIGFYAQKREGIPSILVAHANVSGAQLSTGQTIKGQDIIIPVSTLEASGADYIALGHIHMHQRMSAKAYYAGSTYHCNWGETEQKLINLVEVIPGQDPVVTPLKLTSTVPMVKHTAAFEAGNIIPNPAEPLNDWQGARLRVIVTVNEDERKLYKKAMVKEAYPEAFEYTIDEEIIYTQRTRAEEMKKATTLPDQLKAWAVETSKQDQLSESVFEELSAIELEYHKKNG